MAGKYTLGGEGLAVIAEELRRASELVGEILPARAAKRGRRREVKLSDAFFFLQKIESKKRK